MRPLSSTVKAACFFYLGFVLLLLAINTESVWGFFWSFPVEVIRPRSGVEAANLRELAVSFENSWNRILKNRGLDPTQYSEYREEKLLTKKVGALELNWVRSRTRLELPSAMNESQLVECGGSWRRLAEDQGLEITATDWGYARGRLWVKIKGAARVGSHGSGVRLPVVEITLIQPIQKQKREWDWRGLLPAATPVLKVPPPLKPSPRITRPPLPKQETPPAVQLLKKKARVALIIDDVGFIREPADQLLKIPARLTWSVLPLSPYGQEYAQAAAAKGFEIMLHLPLEPFDSKENPGPGVIKHDWSEEQIQTQLDEDLGYVELAKGVNNHMGSAGTADGRLMEILMRKLKARNLFFIDSYTSSQSVARQYARDYRVPFGRRRVFIDHEEGSEAKKEALRRLIRIALRDGTAVGIAHVRAGTPEAILEVLPEFTAAGVEIVPASEVVGLVKNK